VALNKTPGFILTQFGWSAQNAAELIRASDDGTVVLTFDKAYAPSFIINILSAGVASVVDSEVVKSHEANGDYGYAWLKTRSAGSGPYRIVTWNPKQAVVLEAAPSYWRGTPPIKRIVFNHVAEATSQRLLLEKGDADIARDLTADQIRALASNTALTVESAPKTTIIYLQLNQTYEPLTKPQVQQAFRWLADYQGMGDTFLKGQWGVREGFITTGLPGALTDAPFHLDVPKAKQLLAEAGYPNGFDLELTLFNTAPYTQIAQSLQATLGQAGIRVKLTQLDKAEVFTIIRARKHQATLAYWSPDYLDDNSTTNWFAWSTDIADNAKTHTAAWRNHWLIPELSKQTDDALLEADTAKRNADYEDIQRKVRADGPFIFLFEQNEQIVLRKTVSGFVLGPSFDTPVYWQTKKSMA
jgi:peptide/nickel transport system substrate-binding protein